MTPSAGSAVLIVDDEPGMRKMLEFTLRQQGWEVASAADGPKALELLGRRIFQLMLSDVNMPGMDGLSLLETVKRARRRPRSC